MVQGRMPKEKNRSFRNYSANYLKRILVDVFVLWRISLNSSLKAFFHLLREIVAPSKMTAFLWHHIVQPTIMITLWKILELNCLLLLINISCGDKDVFHLTLTNLQHHLLNVNIQKTDEEDFLHYYHCRGHKCNLKVPCSFFWEVLWYWVRFWRTIHTYVLRL
jgi:hypothetical protein